jgi:hypothetical protein
MSQQKCNCGTYCLACHFGLPLEPPVKSESPFKAGECLCGVPKCNGHEMIDGKSEIPNHPLGHVIIHEGSQP